MSHPSLRFIFSGSALLALIVSLFLVPIGVRPALAASVCYVNASASGANNGSSWAEAYTDLQSALTDDACTEIWVAQGTYTPHASNRVVSFQLKSGVALYGGFDGAETQRAERDFTANPTILSGEIGIQNDNSDNSYHVVYAHGVDNTAVLDGFTISAGNADDSSQPHSNGGGMYSHDSQVTIANVTFRDSHAIWGGGGMYNDGGSPSLMNVIFDGNQAEWYGGGMYNSNGSPSLTKVTFNDNHATWHGGGMYNSNGNPNLLEVVFSNNIAAINGGGLYNENSQPSITKSQFSENQAGQTGGGMASLNSDAQLKQVEFKLNTANEHGGGMANDNSSPELSEATFDRNQATIWGGGMYNVNNSNPSLNKSAFNKNSAEHGGGMYNENSSPELTKVDLDQNEADYGGGIYNNASDATFDSVNFTDNHAEQSGGGMYNKADSSPTLTQSTFDSNTASSGGGMYNEESDPSLLTGVIFKKNSAENTGGGMHNNASSPKLENVTLIDNMSNLGGGIYNEENSQPTLITVTFNSNTANINGGGMFNNGSDPSLSAGSFNNNSAQGNGGGVYNDHSNPSLTGVTLSGNSAQSSGGGVFNDHSSPNLINVTFSNNSTQYDGGGMFNSYSDPSLNAGSFNNNSAQGNGGGMYNDHSNPSLTGVTFGDNTTQRDGGGMVNKDSTPVLTEVIFNGNTAADIGGGMSNDDSNPSLTNVTFRENFARDGGGMHNNDSNPSLTGVTFSSNIATDNGGGIFNSGSHPIITNVTLNGNQAYRGGGIYNFNSKPSLVNVTLGSNSAEYGSGLFITENSQPSLKNVILANTDSPGDNCTFYEGGSLNDESAHNLVSDISCNLIDNTNGNKIGAEHILNIAPLANNGGFTQTRALLFGSVAIDAGLDAACPATDQRGIPRPVGTHCDIGAYEYFANFDTAQHWISAFDQAHGWTVQNHVRTAADVNNDGRADLIGFGLDGVYVALSTGTGFETPTKWLAGQFDQSHGWTVQNHVRTTADVNGDGKADLIGFGLDGVYVALSTGTKFETPTKWLADELDQTHGWTVQYHVRTAADVNGDGRADLIGFGLDGVYVALSDGSKFNLPIKWLPNALDQSHGWTVQNHVRIAADVDGDGQADLVGFGLDGVYVAFSTGTKFRKPVKWLDKALDQSHGWTVQYHVRTTADVNGDGWADLIGFGLDGVYVAPSDGSGFNPVSRWLPNMLDQSHGWTVQYHVRTAADINGDGRADLIGFGLDGVYVALAQATP